MISLFFKEVLVICVFLEQVQFIWSVNLTCVAVVVYIDVRKNIKK